MEAYEKLTRWYLRWLRRGAAVLGAVSAAVFFWSALCMESPFPTEPGTLALPWRGYAPWEELIDGYVLWWYPVMLVLAVLRVVWQYHRMNGHNRGMYTALALPAHPMALPAAVLSATAFLLLGLTELINLLAMAFYPVFTRCAARTAMAEMGAAYVSPVKFNGLYLAFWRSSLLWFTCPRSVNGALLLAALVAFGLAVTAVCTFARRRAVFAGIAGLAAFAALVLWQETQSLRPVLITALAACVIYLWWALYKYRKTRFLD